MSPWLRYLIAFVVACHASIYAALLFVPDMLKVWRGSSWLLGSSLTGDRLKALVVTLHVGAGVLILACALAMALARFVPGWWRPLAIAGGVLGIVAFAVLWDGQGGLVEEGAIGAVVSLLLVASTIVFPEAFS